MNVKNGNMNRGSESEFKSEDDAFPRRDVSVRFIRIKV
jgi:hypothetical protein